MVVALIALFVALGGVSYGLATGSIDGREIKNSTVRSKDVRNNDIRSGDIRNRSLLAKDFKPGQLPAGPRGATGPAGAPATRLFAYVRYNAAPPALQVVYGSGATGVSSDAEGEYKVSFNRDVTGCVAHATPGIGSPIGGPYALDIASMGAAIVDPSVSANNVVSALFTNADGSRANTSFMLSLFC
jgi:hypothetical protein